MRRRRFLALAAAAAASPAAAAARALPAHAARTVSLDWGLAETLIALGAPPLGLGETAGYREWVGVPALPPGVADLGLRSTPSLETIAALRPDVILSTPQFAAIEPVLESVAPVLSLATYTDSLSPLRNAAAITRRLGRLLGREAAAERLIEDTGSRIARLHSLIAAAPARKTLVLVFHDDRHVWVFGPGSLYADVLARAGIPNAWTGEGSAWGIANSSVDQFAQLDDAAVLVVRPVPLSLEARLRARDPDSLIGRIGIFREGAYRVLPPNWGFGGLVSAARFADSLSGLAGFLQGRDAS